jgi:hypothetical protein
MSPLSLPRKGKPERPSFNEDNLTASSHTQDEEAGNLLQAAKITSKQPPESSSIAENQQDEVTLSASKKPGPKSTTKISVLEYFPKHVRAWKTDIARIYASSHRQNGEGDKISMEASGNVLSDDIMQKNKKRYAYLIRP